MNKQTVILIIVGVVVGLPILACGGCMGLAVMFAPTQQQIDEWESEQAAANAAAQQEFAAEMQELESQLAADQSPDGVTMQQFQSIKTGMTYQQVVGILGEPTEQLSQTELAGVRSSMFSWQGVGFGANMNATFTNGRLVAKAQFGLQ